MVDFVAMRSQGFADCQEAYNAVEMLLQQQKSTLRDRFVGLYLGGSIALGDFSPDKSDIDFVCATSARLDDDALDALRQMHRKLGETKLPWLSRLDGSYIPRDVLRVWRPEDEVPFIEGASFTVTWQGSAMVQRHILYQCGVVISGPRPSDLINRVQPSALQRSVSDMLEQHWWPLIEDPDWLRQRSQQSFAVLTICRSIYTIELAEVVSKSEAAAWAKQRFGTAWSGLIDAALERDAQTDRLEQIISFMNTAKHMANNATR